MKVLALINTNLVSENDVTMLPDVNIAGTPIQFNLYLYIIVMFI